MVLTKEYRICMPMTVEEYQIGQLYMIARHSLEQSGGGEGVEVIENVECHDEKHGKGQFTEKRIHLSSRLPYWVQSFTPKIFYVTEKAWNYYPYTVTEYTCLDLNPDQLAERIVEHLDIAYDEVSPKHYKEEEDPRYFQSQKTHRGPLVDGWRSNFTPIMCSYKLVHASFEVFGLQTKVEEFIHSCIREVLLLGHRQAFAWIDEWIGMNLEDVREYEKKLQLQTNFLIQQTADKVTEGNEEESQASGDSSAQLELPGTPKTPKSPSKKGGYFSNWF